jgi:hypothetical protein
MRFKNFPPHAGVLTDCCGLIRRLIYNAGFLLRMAEIPSDAPSLLVAFCVIVGQL